MALANIEAQSDFAAGAARRAGTLEWPLLWATAFAVFALPEARLRVSIVPLEIALALGAAFCFIRFVRLPSLPSRVVFAALLLCAFEVYYYALHWIAAPFPIAVWYFVLSRALAILVAAMLVERLLELHAAVRIIGLCVLIGAGLHATIIILNALYPTLRPPLQELAMLYTSASARSAGATGSVYYDGDVEIYRATGLVGVSTVSNAIAAILGLMNLFLFSIKRRWSFLYLAWLCAIAALLSFSRGAMLALAPALLLVTVSAIRSRPKSRWSGPLVAAPIVGTIALLLYALVSQLSGDQAEIMLRRFAELLDLSSSQSVLDRSTAYAGFFDRLAHDPLFVLAGAGLVERFRAIAGIGPDLSTGFVSNGWLLLLYEYGVLVFVPAVILAFIALKRVWAASWLHALILASLFWLFASDNHIYLSGSLTALWLSCVLFVSLGSGRSFGAPHGALRAG
jgi:hypothetical protein